MSVQGSKSLLLQTRCRRGKSHPKIESLSCWNYPSQQRAGGGVLSWLSNTLCMYIFIYSESSPLETCWRLLKKLSVGLEIFLPSLKRTFGYFAPYAARRGGKKSAGMSLGRFISSSGSSVCPCVGLRSRCLIQIADFLLIRCVQLVMRGELWSVGAHKAGGFRGKRAGWAPWCLCKWHPCPHPNASDAWCPLSHGRRCHTRAHHPKRLAEPISPSQAALNQPLPDLTSCSGKLKPAAISC